MKESSLFENFEESPECSAVQNETEPCFDLAKKKDQVPFRDLGVQRFFERWCAINDGIAPVFLTREEWTEKVNLGILESKADSITKKQNLYIPMDLHLWEMVDVMQAVDYDTYKDKDRSEAKTQLLRQFGTLLKNTATYLRQRLNVIEDGREFAQEIIAEFHDYGNKLEGEVGDDKGESQVLDEKQTEEIDEWLAGDSLYNSRVARAINNEEKEQVRSQTLKQFFRVAQRAFDLSKTQLNPTQGVSQHESFLDTINQNIDKQIEAPRTELYSTIFRRGLHKLYREMKDPNKDWKATFNAYMQKAGINFELKEKTLRETLGVEQMRDELALVRKEGDMEKVVNLEKEYAIKVQTAVSQLTYKKEMKTPVSVLKSEFVDCVGFTMVGAAILKEVGIKVLALNIPQHLSSLLVTSDNCIHTLEMQDKECQQIQLVSEDILTKKQEDIMTYIIKLSTSEQMLPGKVIKLRGKPFEYYKNLFSDASVFRVQNIEVGLQTAILYSLQTDLWSEGFSYEMTAQENIDAVVEHMINGGDYPIKSNNNLLAASNESDRLYKQMDDSSVEFFQRSYGEDFVNSFSLDGESDLINLPKEDAREILVNIKKAKDLRHRGYLEEALKYFKLALNLTSKHESLNGLPNYLKGSINELEKELNK